ncbi:hypothetical protein VR44_30890 [Streptomyces katrae]|uniref:Uncharacterized protein n=1 Tax=Streptomyces katrae TaxID=68223 RepID=A0A0F4IWT2_9ACTN|nr:hypothetical protein [Streptomyces katrae]KJY26094.1 hypothetical protein VR44_30890 [Streptomyces katrae]
MRAGTVLDWSDQTEAAGPPQAPTYIWLDCAQWTPRAVRAASCRASSRSRRFFWLTIHTLVCSVPSGELLDVRPSGGPPFGAVKVLAEPAGPVDVGQPVPDRLVQRGSVPRRREGAVLLVVRAGGGLCRLVEHHGHPLGEEGDLLDDPFAGLAVEVLPGQLGRKALVMFQVASWFAPVSSVREIVQFFFSTAFWLTV